MKKQKRKNLNKILLASVIFILILIIFMFFTKQSFILIGGRPLETQTFTFNGFEGVAESPIFGSVENLGATLSQMEQGILDNSFCGDDGDITVSNSFSSSDTSMSLSTSMIASSRSCKETNGIIAKTKISPGELTVSCSSSASMSGDVFQESERSHGICIVKVNGNEVFKSAIYPNRFGGSDSKTENKVISITEESDLEVIVDSKVVDGIAYSSQGSASLSLEFEPNLIPEQPQTYYRFSNNQCSTISILPSEKTVNDYSTLSECQSKIISNGGNGNEEPKESKINIIGIFIISLILILAVLIVRNIIRNRKKRK